MCAQANAAGPTVPRRGVRSWSHRLLAHLIPTVHSSVLAVQCGKRGAFDRCKLSLPQHPGGCAGIATLHGRNHARRAWLCASNRNRTIKLHLSTVHFRFFFQKKQKKNTKISFSFPPPPPHRPPAALASPPRARHPPAHTRTHTHLTAVGFEPTQLALVELESTPLDHSGKLSSKRRVRGPIVSRQKRRTASLASAHARDRPVARRAAFTWTSRRAGAVSASNADVAGLQKRHCDFAPVRHL